MTCNLPGAWPYVDAGTPKSAAPQLKVTRLHPRAPGVGGGSLGPSEVEAVVELEMPARLRQAFEGGLVRLCRPRPWAVPQRAGLQPGAGPLYLVREGFAGSSTSPTG